MRKVGVGISIVLNVLLLVGLFYAFTSQGKPAECPKCGTDKPVYAKNKVTCIKKIAVDENMTSVESINDQVVLEFDDDGTLTSMKTGIIIKYSSDEIYQNALKNNEAEKKEDLGDRTIYQYTDSKVNVTLEDGKEEEIWFKPIVKSFVDEGYECK